MNRFLAFALILLCCACEKNGPEPEKQENYDFHDDCYVSAKKQYGLEKVFGDSFLIIKEKEMSKALAHLETAGFEVTTEPYRWIYYTSEEYTVEELSKCVALTVHGYGNLKSVPGLVYSNHMYRDEAGEILGKTNTFLIKFTKNQRDAQMIAIKEYARQHKFLILGDASTEYFRLACTNETSGNCVEMANWFLEVAGFKSAEPEFPEKTIDSDNQQQ